ncbi:hypothetical protein CYMTET_34883, partial [Cymbomonas tetramitiformis]
VSVWMTDSPKPVCFFEQGFTKSVVDLAWSSDGYTLFCCSTDGTVARLTFDSSELGTVASREEVARRNTELYGGVTANRSLLIAEDPQQLQYEALANAKQSSVSPSVPAVAATRCMPQAPAATPGASTVTTMGAVGGVATPPLGPVRQNEYKAADGRRRIVAEKVEVLPVTPNGSTAPQPVAVGLLQASPPPPASAVPISQAPPAAMSTQATPSAPQQTASEAPSETVGNGSGATATGHGLGGPPRPSAKKRRIEPTPVGSQGPPPRAAIPAQHGGTSAAPPLATPVPAQLLRPPQAAGMPTPQPGATPLAESPEAARSQPSTPLPAAVGPPRLPPPPLRRQVVLRLPGMPSMAGGLGDNPEPILVEASNSTEGGAAATPPASSSPGGYPASPGGDPGPPPPL